jgi:hypothetical protein
LVSTNVIRQIPLPSKTDQTWSTASRLSCKPDIWFSQVQWEPIEIGQRVWQATWRLRTAHARHEVQSCHRLTVRKASTKNEGENARSTAPLLDVILASLRFAPRHNHYTLIIQRRNDVLPFGDFLQSRMVLIPSTSEHVLLDGLQQLVDGGTDVGDGYRGFDTCITPDGECLLLRDVIGADF